MIEIIVGPMFASKTSALLQRIRRASIAYIPAMIFKPSMDYRYGQNTVASHDQVGMPATPIPIDNPWILFEYLPDDIQVVGIDEIQFFGPDIVPVVRELSRRGLRVILSGLDMDYRGEPFGHVPELLAIAEKVDKLTAVCTVCGKDATRTQKYYASSGVDVGAQDKYTARCVQHFSIPEEEKT